MPPSGTIHLLAAKIAENDRIVHWNWTLVGDRNWKVFENRDSSVRLSSTYPLNSTTVTGGTHVWEYDVTATEGAAHNAPIQIRTVLHGSNGATATSDLTLVPSTAALDTRVTILQTDSVELRLPADVPLVNLDGKIVVLHVEK